MIVHGCQSSKEDPRRGKFGFMPAEFLPRDEDPDPIHVRVYKAQLAWRREDVVSRRSIAEALASPVVRDRILLVPYDELGWLGAYHWRRIVAHIGLESLSMPRGFSNFSSGDGRWLTREHLGDMIRAAADPGATWNATAVGASLRLHATLPSNATDEFVQWWAGTGRPAPSDAAAAFNTTARAALARWATVDATIDGASPARGYTDAEVKAQVEDAHWAKLARKLSQLRQRAVAEKRAAAARAWCGLTAVAACVLLCVLPSPCRTRRVRARLKRHVMSITLRGAPAAHLGVTLGAPSHHDVGRDAAVEVLHVVEADLFSTAGVRAGDLLLHVEGATPADAAGALAALDAAIGDQRARAGAGDDAGVEAQAELSLSVGIVRADAVQRAVDEARLDVAPLWIDAWRAIYYHAAGGIEHAACACRLIGTSAVGGWYCFGGGRPRAPQRQALAADSHALEYVRGSGFRRVGATIEKRE